MLSLRLFLVHFLQQIFMFMHLISRTGNDLEKNLSVSINEKLNRIHERALRLVCKDSESELEKLKKKYGTIHQHNLQLLMTEIFKTKNNLNPIFMKNIFTERNMQYSLRNENHLRLPKVKTTTYGIENIQYRGCHLWSSLPSEIKDSNTLAEFKRKIKSWKENTCICRLCKVFIKDLGFL